MKRMARPVRWDSKDCDRDSRRLEFVYEGEKEEREGRSVYICSEALLADSLLSKVGEMGRIGSGASALGPTTTCMRGSHVIYEWNRTSRICRDISCTNKSEWAFHPSVFVLARENGFSETDFMICISDSDELRSRALNSV